MNELNILKTRFVITTLPVNQFLKMSQLQTAPMKQMPVALVESQPMLAYA